MKSLSRPWLTLRLPPLDGATAAWLLDLCGLMQRELWRQYGEEIEAHWSATEPNQPIYGRLENSRRRR